MGETVTASPETYTLATDDAVEKAPPSPEAQEQYASTYTEAHEQAPDTEDSSPDYGQIIVEDTERLRSLFPELSKIESITELDNPLRYAELRDMGLSPEEAYLATAGRRKSDNRAHLSTAVPKPRAEMTGIMTRSELSAARDYLDGLTDAEIQALYRRIIK